MNFNSIWLKNRLYYSQIEQFSFDLAIEYLVDCYYPPGLRAFELSARAVQFFKTYTGKILRIWGISSKKILRKRIFFVNLPPIVTSTSKDFEYIHYETKEYRHRLDKSHTHYSHDIDSYRELRQRIPPPQGRHSLVHDAYLPHHYWLSREY